MEKVFSAFITNLGKYNEGELEGKWLDFPCTEDEWNDCLKEIGIGSKDEFGQPYEEYFVTDYDSQHGLDLYGQFGEYPSYEEMNDLAERLTTVDLEAVENLMEVVSDIEEVIDGLEKGDMYYHPGITTESELGEWFVDEMYGGDASSFIDDYFDVGQLGRDLSFDEWEDDNGERISAAEFWCGDEDATDEEIGQAYIDAVGIEGVSSPENYIDYEAIGYMLTSDSFTFTKDGVVEVI